MTNHCWGFKKTPRSGRERERAGEGEGERERDEIVKAYTGVIALHTLNSQNTASVFVFF